MDAIFDYKLNPADDLYAIIGCDELSTPEQILTEYRIKAVECHPDKNIDQPDALEKFQKLQKAKDVLTDEKLRKDYDQWKRSGLAIPYDEWQARKDSIKMSMHWVTKTKKEPAIEAAPAFSLSSSLPATSHMASAASSQRSDPDEPDEPKVFWTSAGGSEALRKFRNYEL